MNHIFISHVEEDGDVALEVAEGLEKAGYSTWYYERDSLPGVDYLLQVKKAIEASSAVVLIISAHSLGSNQVSIEVVRAHECDRPFMPLLRDLTHAKFQQRQPDWGIALGATASIAIPPPGVSTIMDRMTQGLRARGIAPAAASPQSSARPARTPPPVSTERETKGGILLPPGWTFETRRVQVITPEGPEQKEIGYYTNSIGMKLVLVPAGEFMMGGDEPPGEVVRKCNTADAKAEWFQSEQPQHRVRITRPFLMGACEVTQAQYENIIGTNPADFKGDNNPVEQVSWTDATEFCRRISQKEGVEYRLPSEAEWEYACRAGSSTPFYTGATISTGQANYDGNYTYGSGAKGESRGRTIAVGSFPPNGFGLYDMHGNVWEWCQDWYGADYYGSSPESDPPGPSAGAARVVRGGSWVINPKYCRAAGRGGYGPSDRGRSVGFRVAGAAVGVR